MKKTILLLGGGFLGKAIGKHLSKNNYVVHILSPEKIILQDSSITIHRGSLDDISILEKILPLCSSVIHLASATIPGDSVKGPVFEIENNLSPTIRFLEVFQKFQHIEKLIFISSGGACYLSSLQAPITENQPPHPFSYYGAGKVAIESFLNAFANIHNRNIIILRPSNLYGPTQPLYKGFGLIRTMLDKILTNTTMEIWGNGEVIRDYIYIEDIVKLIETLLITSKITGVYNVGSNKGYSINQVKDLVETVTEKKLPVVYKPQRNVDINRVILDCSKLNNQINWKPATDLNEGIAHTWSWLKKNLI